MSLETRKKVVSNLVFQKQSQASDLLNPALTDTYLIAGIEWLIERGHNIEILSVRSDHGDDSSLGPFAHAFGKAIDCWPLASKCGGDWLDPNDSRFRSFLDDTARVPHWHQTCLGGTARIPGYIDVRVGFFDDNDQDHIHFSAGV